MVVVGAGPVGLAAIMTARSTGAERVIAEDTNEYRLERAKDFGATDVVMGGEGARETVKGMTKDGLGVDVAIEAGKVTPEEFVTHRFTFDEWEQAYDTFGRAAEEKALKVIVSAS